MPRPRRHRRIEWCGKVTAFKPQGISLRGLERMSLEIDELEALRLVDAEGLDQATAAGKMAISQPTLNRVLRSARQKVARTLTEGLAITITQGGENMPNKDGTGPEGKGPMTGRGAGPCNTSGTISPRPRRGRGTGQGRGPGRFGR